MAEKKKMSVAEILAAARKADGETAEGADADEGPPPSEEKTVPKAKGKPAAKVAAATKGGERPGVADILAAARGEKAAGKPSPAAKSKVEAAAKPTATKAAKPSAKPAAKKAPSGPMETASILAAARSAPKPGPISKAEAAKQQAVTGKPAKAKLDAPPMPPKPGYARPKPAPEPKVDRGRRSAILSMLVGSSLALGFSSLAATLGLWTFGLVRFMFPNILREPPSQFRVGSPGDFAPGQVETKFKAKFGVWVVNSEYNGQSQIYALMSVCTHLGCTPNWLEGEQKFKCPCHGSGFYKDGVNFEGPAPRPLERYAISIADDGQLEIDKSKTFQEEMGEWEDPDSFVIV